MKLNKISNSILILVIILVCFGVGVMFARAASVTNFSDTMSRLATSTASSHIIKFTTPTGASDSTDTIIITFPSDFNFTGKAATSSVTFTHGATTGAENTETLAASPSATAWGAAFSGTQNRVYTLTAPTDGIGTAAVAASDIIIITYNNSSSTNPTTAGAYVITISGTFGDSGSAAVRILSDDQVRITATVDPTLTFTISDNDIGFGSLSASDARFATGDAVGTTTEAAAHTITASTNARSGYIITLNGSTLADTASSSITISAIGATAAASTVGSEQFGVRYTASGGTGIVTAPYNDATPKWAFDTAAFPDQIASTATSSDTTTYSAYYIANIAGSTEAGSYASTLTYIATATF